MTNLLATFATVLQSNADREDAIKACRSAQARAYVAQKAANVPQAERCKAPAFSKYTTLVTILAMTKVFEKIAAHPRMTNARREILAKRVAVLTGITPGPETSVEEMLETIEDYEGQRTSAPPPTVTGGSTPPAPKAYDGSISRAIRERRVAALASRIGQRAPLCAARPDLVDDRMLSAIADELAREARYLSYRRAG